MENTNKKIWNDIKCDLVAGVTSFSQCMAIGDVSNEGDNKLLCGDIGHKLKVFKLECLDSETKLQFSPVAIVCYKAYDINTKSIINFLAVAGGSNIYIYHNMKGKYKLLVPNIEINSLEQQIWEDLKQSKIENQKAIEKLKDMNNQSKFIIDLILFYISLLKEYDLSTRSLELISIKNEFEASNYIMENRMESLSSINYIVTMSSIKKINYDDEEGVSQLVVGTEGKNVFIVDGSDTKILKKFQLSGIPSSISCFGAYDTDYRIHVACRNEIIYTLKNGEIVKTIIQVSSKIVNILRLEKSLYVICMNSFYHSYNPTGNKIFSIKQPSEIYCLEECNIKKTRGFKALLLGLKNTEIRLYNDKLLINVITIPETIFGMKFGRLGKSDDMLVVCSDKGSIYIKQLEKSVNLDGISHKKINYGGEETTLNIPKKTTMFLDLMEREKEYYKCK